MNLNQMIYRKEKKGYSYQKLSELSGVPLGTLQKIFNGQTKNPRYETLQAIEAVLKEEDEPYCDRVCEVAPFYGSKEQKYTIEDYYALPEDKWVELIDGVFYDMTAPATVHQIVSMEMTYQIMSFVKKNKGKCIPLAAPVDVQLDKDEYTMLQPDVLIVCDRDKVERRCVYGAPDFVVEILSPSTRKKDCGKKLAKYMEAGVREYWIVDSDHEKIVVYPLEQEELPVVYGFQDKIPVRIYDGKLEIDFAEIDMQLKKWG